MYNYRVTILDAIELGNLESLWVRYKNPNKDITIEVFYGMHDKGNQRLVDPSAAQQISKACRFEHVSR